MVTIFCLFSDGKMSKTNLNYKNVLGFKLMVNGFHLEQIGANSIDQLSTILYFAESLIGKMEPKNISFEIGIGSNFFLELAKVRALKWLWRHILLKNNKATRCTATVGHYFGRTWQQEVIHCLI